MKHGREKFIMYIKKAFGLLISQTHNAETFIRCFQMEYDIWKYIGREKDVKIPNSLECLSVIDFDLSVYNYICRAYGYNLISSLFPGWFCGRREHPRAKIEQSLYRVRSVYVIYSRLEKQHDGFDVERREYERQIKHLRLMVHEKDVVANNASKDKK